LQTCGGDSDLFSPEIESEMNKKADSEANDLVGALLSVSNFSCNIHEQTLCDL